jgi:hypothetical protein
MVSRALHIVYRMVEARILSCAAGWGAVGFFSQGIGNTGC